MAIPISKPSTVSRIRLASGITTEHYAYLMARLDTVNSL